MSSSRKRDRKRDRDRDRARDRSLASEAARLVLDEVGLRTYLVAVELLDGEWIVSVEHPKDGAWQEVIVSAAPEELLASHDDPRRRAALASAWRPELLQREAA